jgi:hypothetical protein
MARHYADLGLSATDAERWDVVPAVVEEYLAVGVNDTTVFDFLRRGVMPYEVAGMERMRATDVEDEGVCDPDDTAQDEWPPYGWVHDDPDSDEWELGPEPYDPDNPDEPYVPDPEASGSYGEPDPWATDSSARPNPWNLPSNVVPLHGRGRRDDSVP